MIKYFDFVIRTFRTFRTLQKIISSHNQFVEDLKMAYKLLNRVLSLDIVKHILEYKGYSTSTNDLYLRKILITLNISSLKNHFSWPMPDIWPTEFIWTKENNAFIIKQLKTYTYIRTYYHYYGYIEHTHLKSLLGLNISTKHIEDYTLKNIIRCEKCNKFNALQNIDSFCLKCIDNNYEILTDDKVMPI